MKTLLTINYVKYYQLYHLGIIFTTVILFNLYTGISNVTFCEGIPELQHALYPKEFEDLDKSLQKQAMQNYEAYLANKTRNDSNITIERAFPTAPRPTDDKFKSYLEDPNFILNTEIRRDGLLQGVYISTEITNSYYNDDYIYTKNTNNTNVTIMVSTPEVLPILAPITSNVSTNNNLLLLKTEGLENVINIMELPIKHDLADIARLNNKLNQCDAPIAQRDNSNVLPLIIKNQQPIAVVQKTQSINQECIETQIQSSDEPLPLTLVPISQHDDPTTVHLTSIPNKNIIPIKPDIPLEPNLPISCTISKPDVHIIPDNVPVATKDVYLYKKQPYLRYLPDTMQLVYIDYKTEAEIIDELEMSYSIKKIQLIDTTNSKPINLSTGQLPIAKEALKDIPSVIKQENVIGRHQAYHPIILKFFDYVNSDNYDPLTPANFVFNNAELLFTESSDYLIKHFDLIWSTADKSNQEYVLYHKNFMVHALYMIKLKEIASNFNESINLFDTQSIFNDIKTFINFRYPEHPL
jgi:hypothetical protein